MTPKPQAPNAFTLIAPMRIKPTHVSKAMATRINKNIHIAAHCGATQGQRAAR